MIAARRYLVMLMGGLAGKSTVMISATIEAYGHVFMQLRAETARDVDDSAITELLGNLILLLQRHDDPVVMKATLAFFKDTLTVMPAEVMQGHLPQLVPALLRWNTHSNESRLKACPFPNPVIGSIARGTQRLNCSMRGSIDRAVFGYPPEH